MPSDLQKVAKRPAGVNPLNQKEKPEALFPEEGRGVICFKKYRICTQMAEVQILPLPFSACVIASKFRNLSVPL